MHRKETGLLKKYSFKTVSSRNTQSKCSAYISESLNISFFKDETRWNWAYYLIFSKCYTYIYFDSISKPYWIQSKFNLFFKIFIKQKIWFEYNLKCIKWNLKSHWVCNIILKINNEIRQRFLWWSIRILLQDTEVSSF